MIDDFLGSSDSLDEKEADLARARAEGQAAHDAAPPETLAEAALRTAKSKLRRQRAREVLVAELRAAHNPTVYALIMELPPEEQRAPNAQYVLAVRKSDLEGIRSLTRAEREHLAKYEAKRLASEPVYAKEFEVSALCKCGNATVLRLSKSDVRNKRWVGMIGDACRNLCAICVERKYQDDAPIRAAAAGKVAEYRALRDELQSLLLSGEAASLLDASELASADPQTQMEIYLGSRGWWRQQKLNGVPLSTEEGRQIAAAVDREFERGYDLLWRRSNLRNPSPLWRRFDTIA